MRQGQNPAKQGLLAYQPCQLGILLLVYIPTQSGYFTDSLRVLEYQVASLHKNTPDKFNLHIFDNGSCKEVLDALKRLQAEGLVDWLTTSRHNLGKAGALNWALRGMPNEVICYSDGDVYFRSGWYESSLEILKAIPGAGMVTAQPCFFDNLKGQGRAALAIRDLGGFQITTRLSDSAAAEEYVRSIGDNSELHEKYSQHTWQVIKNQATGLEAVVGASPFQFLAYKSKLEKILPLTYSHAMREDAQIAARMDTLGLLQLSTVRPYVYHMGNQLDETTRNEAQRDNLDGSLIRSSNSIPRQVDSQTKPAKQKTFRLLNFLARLSIFKRSFLRLYNLLFEYYLQAK